MDPLKESRRLAKGDAEETTWKVVPVFEEGPLTEGPSKEGPAQGPFTNEFMETSTPGCFEWVIDVPFGREKQVAAMIGAQFYGRGWVGLTFSHVTAVCDVLGSKRGWTPGFFFRRVCETLYGWDPVFKSYTPFLSRVASFIIEDGEVYDGAVWLRRALIAMQARNASDEEIVDVYDECGLHIGEWEPEKRVSRAEMPAMWELLEIVGMARTRLNASKGDFSFYGFSELMELALCSENSPDTEDSPSDEEEQKSVIRFVLRVSRAHGMESWSFLSALDYARRYLHGTFPKVLPLLSKMDYDRLPLHLLLYAHALMGIGCLPHDFPAARLHFKAIEKYDLANICASWLFLDETDPISCDYDTLCSTIHDFVFEYCLARRSKKLLPLARQLVVRYPQKISSFEDDLEAERDSRLNDAEPGIINKPVCVACGLKSNSFCSCMQVRYCSQGCQNAHWRQVHKRTCSYKPGKK